MAKKGLKVVITALFLLKNIRNSVGEYLLVSNSLLFTKSVVYYLVMCCINGNDILITYSSNNSFLQKIKKTPFCIRMMLDFFFSIPDSKQTMNICKRSSRTYLWITKLTVYAQAPGNCNFTAEILEMPLLFYK